MDVTPIWKSTLRLKSSERKRLKLFTSCRRSSVIEPESSTTQRISTMPSDCLMTSACRASARGGSMRVTRPVGERSTLGGASSTGDSIGGATEGTALKRPFSRPTWSQAKSRSTATRRRWWVGCMARSANLVDLALLMQVSCLARNWSFLRHPLYMRAIVPTTFVPPMRAFVLGVLTVSGVLFASCRCSPATAVPITMKVVNSTKEPIYVDAVEGKLGLTVQRNVLGQLYPFDDLVCECRYCANACGACAFDCPDGGAMVRRIAPGDVASREWDGVVQVSGLSQCLEGGACLNQENAPLNEPFVLKLCFMAQKPTGVTSFDDAGLAPGQIEVAAQTCVEKTFKIEDGVVEIGPERGATCVTTADCRGTDELCFAGSCTTGCPANAYPAPGSSNLVLSMGNLSSFSRSTIARATKYSGTGTISATEYQGTTLQNPPGGAPE